MNQIAPLFNNNLKNTGLTQKSDMKTWHLKTVDSSIEIGIMNIKLS